MKKFVFALCLLAMSSVNAGVDVSSFRTPSGDIVNINDSESELLSKMGKSKPTFYVYKDKKYSCAATEYKYRIDFTEYTVVLCYGKIIKISYENA